MDAVSTNDLLAPSKGFIIRLMSHTREAEMTRQANTGSAMAMTISHRLEDTRTHL